MGKASRKVKSINKLLIFILLPILLIATSNIWMPLPGEFLAVKDNFQNADCIVPLGGDYYSRFKKAVELYNQEYAKNIVFSVLPERESEPPDFEVFVLKIFGLGTISQKEFALKVFEYFGKGAENIYFTDYDITSTYEEALATKDFMLKKGLKSFILVTSTYHMRRSLMIFKSVFKDANIKIYNCAAGGELYNPGKWWRKERDVKAIIGEYLSIIQNFIYHSVLKKKRTSFDTYY